MRFPGVFVHQATEPARLVFSRKHEENGRIGRQNPRKSLRLARRARGALRRLVRLGPNSDVARSASQFRLLVSLCISISDASHPLYLNLKQGVRATRVQVQLLIFIRDNARKGSVKVRLDNSLKPRPRERVGKSALRKSLKL